jgi:hypothetical protein
MEIRVKFSIHGRNCETLDKLAISLTALCISRRNILCILLAYITQRRHFYDVEEKADDGLSLAFQ